MKWKEHAVMKALAFIMAVAAFTTTAIMGWYQITNFDVIWGDLGPGEGYTTYYLESKDYQQIYALVSLKVREEAGETLTVYEEQAVARREERLSAQNTNLRWQVRDEYGQICYGNTAQEDIPAQAEGVFWGNDTYSSSSGEDVRSLSAALWLEGDMPVDDQYSRAYRTLGGWKENRVPLLSATVVCGALGLMLTVYLVASAGHKRGRDGIYLNWFHRIPGDLLLVLLLFAAWLCIAVAAEWLLYRGYYVGVPMYIQLTVVGATMASGAALAIGGLITLAARCKGHTLLRNTLVWRFCHWLWGLCRRVLAALPLIWKAVLAALVYILATVLTFQSAAGLWLLITAGAAAYLCVWAYQWKKIRRGTQAIIRGNADYHIDSRRMLPDLKGHADELNNLSQSISVAVDERMRSEHFKAELITNVSHDLKTPLTSIINYVDLLKKEEIDDPKVAEYIEVLDRKSQRLKKLTEDLVEASKASTGSLTVLRERLDLKQLLDQALAEYGDRLESKRLSVVCTLPDGPVWVEADGRHLWRVVDNLLSNCAKYALEGTRVYLEISRYSDCASVSIKNISREELNVPAERLMERFVRGDESRTAEGSGLGLSIAQSLTELQHGQFAISIDGDLFKATITLPRAADAE